MRASKEETRACTINKSAYKCLSNLVTKVKIKMSNIPKYMNFFVLSKKCKRSTYIDFQK